MKQNSGADQNICSQSTFGTSLRRSQLRSSKRTRRSGPVTPARNDGGSRCCSSVILHRSALIDYVIAAETRGGQGLTPGDALAELLADIAEAARTIGTNLQQVGDRRKA